MASTAFTSTGGMSSNLMSSRLERSWPFEQRGHQLRLQLIGLQVLVRHRRTR